MPQGSPMAQWIKNLPALQETQEIQVQSLGQEDPPKEENGNPLQYSCWTIPWAEEPDRLTVLRVPKSQIWLSN